MLVSHLQSIVKKPKAAYSINCRGSPTAFHQRRCNGIHDQIRTDRVPWPLLLSPCPRESLLVASELGTKSWAFTCISRSEDTDWHRASRRTAGNHNLGKRGANDRNWISLAATRGTVDVTIALLCPSRLAQVIVTSNPDTCSQARSPASFASIDCIADNSMWRSLSITKRLKSYRSLSPAVLACQEMSVVTWL